MLPPYSLLPPPNSNKLEAELRAALQSAGLPDVQSLREEIMLLHGL